MEFNTQHPPAPEARPRCIRRQITGFRSAGVPPALLFYIPPNPPASVAACVTLPVRPVDFPRPTSLQWLLETPYFSYAGKFA
jgi:hypothetical protein